MKNHLPRYSALLAAVVAAITGSAVSAQEQLEEIVVTARQRSELLSDVPASITAFTEDDIKMAGIERAEDFIALTPGVSLVNTAEVGDSQVSIRGINGSRDAEANFAFIVDGILHTNPSAFTREYADLQQIEVLKGPQGAIYGRSAAAGAIIVTTKKPGDEFEANIKASAGNNDSYYVSAVASGPIAEDQLYGRIHVDYRDTDGFYHNSFLDKDKVDNFENYNVNGRLLWEPNDAMSLDFRGHYGEVDAQSITFNAAFALPVFGFVPRGAPLFENVNDHEFVFQPNRIPTNDQESMDFSLKFDWDMDWASVTAWGMYSDIEQNFLADGTSGAFSFFAADPMPIGAGGTPEGGCPASLASLFAQGVTLPPPQFLGPTPALPTFLGPYTPTTCDGYQYQVRNQEDLSFEIRLTSRDDQRLRWQAGFYYLDLEREVGVAQLRDDGRAELIDSLVNPLTEALVHDDFDTRVWAVFGQLAFDVNDDIELSAALRYDNEKREVSSLVPSPDVQRSNFIDYTVPFLIFPLGATGCDDGLAGSPLNPAYVDFTNCTILSSIPDRDKTFDEVQPKISATWDVTDRHTLFASWGVGFKSGGFNNQGSAATVDLFFNTPALGAAAGLGGAGLSISDQFEEETSSAFEVGFKSRFADGRVKVEGAMFYTEVDDMQVFNFFVGAFGLLRVVSNIDEVSMFGVDFAVDAQATDNWRFFAGVGMVNGEIDKDTNRPQAEGNEIPYSPRFTFNVGSEYVIPDLVSGIDFIGRADLTGVGPTWFSELQDGDQVPTLFTPFGFGLSDQSLAVRETYAVLNVRGGVQGDNWGVYAFAKNLTNTHFLDEVIPAPEFGGSFIHPGTERQWGVEFSYSY